MSERRRGLGRGLGALIPTAPARESKDGGGARRTPVDVFFPDRDSALRLITAVALETTAVWGQRRYLDMSLLGQKSPKAA